MPDRIGVLILDDDPAVSASLRAYLEDAGFDLHCAETCAAGLDILASAPIDVAIVDIRLRGTRGDQFILSAHQFRPGITFLIHTGSSIFRPSPALRAIGVTEADVLYKPIPDLEVLVKRIRNSSPQSG